MVGRSRSPREEASRHSAAARGASPATRQPTHQPERTWVWTCTATRYAPAHGRATSPTLRHATEDEADAPGRLAQVDLHAAEVAGGFHVDDEGDAARLVDEVGGGVG